VADKGTPAALFMAVCRTLLRAAAVSQRSPARTLMQVNDLLLSDAGTDLFVTMFYAVWDPQTATVTYASGGHNPPLLVRASGEIVELDSRGIALGVIRDIELDEYSVTLGPGDMLVAYTDGVTEAMKNNYVQWGVERFREALARAPHGADATIQHVLHEIDQFVSGAHQSDDLTMWVLRRKNEAE